MPWKSAAVAVLCLLPLFPGAQERASYSWVDNEGVRHYGDRIPPEYADKPKSVVNEQGVVVDHISGRKTQAERAAEAAAAEQAAAKELQERADRALLATYQNVKEIELHRDRRVQLFQAQARVTELYLRNLNRRLENLRSNAQNYLPYSSDPDAPMIQSWLVEDIQETERSIDRQESNLQNYRHNEQKIIQQFNREITRFRHLKGLPLSTAQAVPE